MKLNEVRRISSANAFALKFAFGPRSVFIVVHAYIPSLRAFVGWLKCMAVCFHFERVAFTLQHMRTVIYILSRSSYSVARWMRTELDVTASTACISFSTALNLDKRMLRFNEHRKSTKIAITSCSRNAYILLIFGFTLCFNFSVFLLLLSSLT